VLAAVAAGTAATLAQVAVRTAESALIGAVLASVVIAHGGPACLWFDLPRRRWPRSPQRRASLQARCCPG
jgi:hypothetical protein